LCFGNRGAEVLLVDFRRGYRPVGVQTVGIEVVVFFGAVELDFVVFHRTTAQEHFQRLFGCRGAECLAPLGKVGEVILDEGLFAFVGFEIGLVGCHGDVGSFGVRWDAVYDHTARRGLHDPDVEC